MPWLNRTVIGIGLASFFSDVSHETVTALLPAYLASIGVAAGALGTIEGLADGLSAFAKLYGGWLADRVRRRKTVAAAGYAFMALSPLVIASAASWLVVLAGRVLAWVSRGIRTPARKALLADAVPAEAYGRAFGLERAMDTCGAIVAPAAMVLLLTVGFSHRRLILFSVVPALLATLAIIFFVRERQDRRVLTGPFLGGFRGLGRPYRRFLTAVGLFGLGDFADTFYILYAVSLLTPLLGEVRATAASVALYTLHNVLYAGWSYLGGWVADRVDRRVLLACGYGCAALAAACMLVGVENFPVPGPWGVYVGLAVMFALGGAGVGIYEAVEDTIAAELLPSELRGTGFGALAVVTGLGDLVSSLLFGWIWAMLGLGAACLCALVPMLSGTVLVVRLTRAAAR